jgi:hypothetical protein
MSVIHPALAQSHSALIKAEEMFQAMLANHSHYGADADVATILRK